MWERASLTPSAVLPLPPVAKVAEDILDFWLQSPPWKPLTNFLFIYFDLPVSLQPR
jgi:hypothetical protein